MSTTVMPNIHALLSLENIRVGLPGRTKKEVLDALLSVLDGHPAVTNADMMKKAVFDREKVMSTGVGKGLGLPHAKTPGVKEILVAFAITEEPVDFGSIDNQDVRLLFLLVGNESDKSQHIKVLSRISRLMNRDAFRKRLLTAKDAEEVLSLIQKEEELLAEH